MGEKGGIGAIHPTSCDTGFTSDGSKCEPCPSDKYGEKCGKICICDDSECYNITGTDVNCYHHTSRFVTFIGFLLHKCWNAFINPLKGNDRNTNEIGHGQRKDEEGIESVYNEIDELAMNTITPRTSFHHSYLELPNIPSSKLNENTCSTPISVCSTQLRSKSQPGQHNSRHQLKEHTTDQHSSVELQSIEIMFEHRESSLPSNATVKGIQNKYSVSQESTYIGFGRSMSYNKLTLKDVRSQARRINVVDNPIYHETVNRQPKSATSLLKRKTI
ncbi:unnamed protein product [Mytilus edulis]|uniref:Uncharacterized protein n=1 Tax=Mytilus edulis TaxID=6550 RepID=A0A8S3V846_MYTED|nr:unnamed protein product [Mytilus edulis]